MTLNDKIGGIIRGTHVVSEDGLRDYHRIQAVKDAMRKRDRFERFVGIKTELKNYRVMVNFTADDKARIFNPETNQEVIL
jgi:hypothetical protein